MTEQEYSNICDLRSVIAAETTLRYVCIDNQPNIDKEEFQTVVMYLSKWETQLFKALPEIVAD